MNKDKKKIIIIILTLALLWAGTNSLYAQEILTESQREYIHRLRQQYPFLNRGQLLRAAENPEGFNRWLQKNGNKHKEWWDNLDPKQREDYKNRMDKWQKLDPGQKKYMKDRYRRIKEMEPQERQKLRENYKKWQDLTDEEKQEIRSRRERFRRMTPQQKEKIKQKRQEWRNLPEDQKKKLRDTYQRRKNFKDKAGIKERLRRSDSQRKIDRRGSPRGSRRR